MGYDVNDMRMNCLELMEYVVDNSLKDTFYPGHIEIVKNGNQIED